MYRKFSRPPSIGGTARAPSKGSRDNAMDERFEQFKRTYVFERRMLERFRFGNQEQYEPAASLDGKSLWDTPEVRVGKNAWIDAYNKILKSHKQVEPTLYVRILFRALFGSALAIPTVQQLSSKAMLLIVDEFLKNLMLDMRQQFVAQNQRAEIAINIQQRIAKEQLGLAVYSVLRDSRISLSYLFQYCLAVETIKQLRKANKQLEWVPRLRALAKEVELPAAFEYSLFPKEYDRIWGSAIPQAFPEKAEKLMKEVF